MSDEEKNIEKDDSASIDANESGIPGFGFRRDLMGDSTEVFEAFHQPGKYTGANQGYGGTVADRWRKFYSLREPVGYWWVTRVGEDIWDNWWKIYPVDNPDDRTLNNETQALMNKLNAKVQFPRETVFERRYGTALMLYSYTKQGEWEEPLKPSGQLMQITPYPWTQVNVSEVDEDEESPRFGLPLYYEVTRGVTNADASTLPTSTTSTDQLKVHWTKAYCDAPRLDEHPYVGYPAIDVIFDDLVGGRNSRWGMYQGYYRNGQGFPVVKTKGTRKENEAWIDSGGLDEYLNARGYIVLNVDEEFEFKGAQDSVQNPATFFDTYFTFIAAATGVAKDTISGVSAGRVTGSEVNERQYFKAISLQQHKKEPFLRDVIDRLIKTGQIKFNGEYVIDWVDPFEVNPQDKAAIEFMETRTRALKTWKTINEVREEENLPPVEEGDVLMLLPGQMVPGGSEPAPNQKEPERPETEPEEGSPNESTLLDRMMSE